NAEEVKPAIIEALNNGDTASAISLLNNEISVDKAYHYNYYILGMIRYNQDRLEEARDLFLTALDKKKNHLESKYQLGLCYIKLGNLDAALEQMTEGRKKARNGMKNIFENGYGLVMLAKQNYTEADLAFRQAIVGDSTIAEYHINLGDANFYSGVPYLAMMEYEKALQLDTAGLEVYFHWAEACLEAKDYTCAIEKLRTVLTKDSTHAPAWMRAGEIYFKAGLSSRTREERNERFKETIGSYKRFLELTNAIPDSSNVRVFFGLAMAYANLYGYEDAVKYFDAVLSIPYEARDIYFNYGKALWGIKDYEKSTEMLLKHIEWVKKQGADYDSRISDVELYQLLGDDYFYRDPKDYSTAIGYYKKSLEKNPDQNRILQNVAVGYHSLQSYAQAIEYYDKRIEAGVDSSNMNIIKNAAYCALNLANQAGEGGDEEFVDEEGEAAPPANPDELYRKTVDYMTQYLQYDPSDSKALMMVANTNLYQLGNCEEGVKYFQQLLTIEPDNCDAKKSLGYAYFGGVCNKNYSKALGYLVDAYNCIKADANGGPCSDVPLVLWVAQCYHLRAADKSKEKEGSGEDDFREAYDWYGKVLKCDPNHAEAKKNRDEIKFEFSEK
ncbi:MAG: tetratricopeptide repeat protein, partial [bacterium]